MRNSPLAKTRGHYAVSAQTGAIAAGMAANGQILNFRWTDADHLAIITDITCTGMIATTAFAVGAITLKATVARAFTASGSGGGTVDFGGDSNVDNAALRTAMADSLVADFRVATTAALTAGTQALEANDLGQITTHSSGGWSAATPIIGSIYLPTNVLFKAELEDAQFPLVLSADEGFVVRATVPATGVWIGGIQVKWAEVEEKFF